MDNLLDYAGLVRAMARRYQGPGLEREDLEQEAWLAVLEGQENYRPELMVPRPAYYQSRVRAALGNVLRRYRRDALFWRSGYDVEIVPGQSPEGEGITELLGALPLRQRQVLSLYYLHDLPLREIARNLGISLSAAHTHKQRGLATLRLKSCSKKSRVIAPGTVKGGDSVACGKYCSKLPPLSSLSNRGECGRRADLQHPDSGQCQI